MRVYIYGATKSWRKLKLPQNHVHILSNDHQQRQYKKSHSNVQIQWTHVWGTTEREKKWKQANERKKCTELLNYHRQCQTIWKERKKIEYKKHTLPIITCRQIWELARPTGAYKTDDDDDDIIKAKDCLVVCLANRPTGRW